MKATKNINIYLINKKPIKVIDVVQYDTGIQLVFTVKDFPLPVDATATLYVEKPSGNFVYQKDNITVVSDTITVDLENQALTEYGRIPYQVTVTSGSDTVTTFTGLMIVERSLKDAGAVESRTVIRAFDEVTVDEITEFQASARTIADAVIATIPDDYTELSAKVNESANAIKGKLSGAVVAAGDVSPVEHLMNVKVHGKNLAKRTNANKTETSSGITYTVLEDGRISASGTATSTAYYILTGSTDWAYQTPIQKGIYTIPKAPIDGCRITVGIRENQNAERVLYYSTSTNTVTFEVTSKEARFDMILCVDTGKTVAGAIFAPQLEEGNTATEYTPYVDPSTAKVKKHGKNLFPVTVGTYNGVTLSKYNDYYVLNGKATGSGLFITKIGKLPPGTYTLSANNPSHNGLGHIFVPIVQVYSPDTLESVAVIDDQVNGVATATIKGGKNYESRIRYQEGVTYNNFIVKPQFELNNTVTEYEAYKEVTEYIPTSDGVVEGVGSLSPNMTILTDTEGVIVECEYNKDTNKVVQKLADALGITI